MNPHYNELTVLPSHSPQLFLDFINEIFPDTIEELDDTIIIRSEEDLSDIEWAIQTYAQELAKALDQEVTVQTAIEVKSNEDWIKSYQQGVEPVSVGSFYIHPSWYEPKESAINIMIDPALAFGSGHHPTTAGCLEAIDTYVKADQKVVDVGCGSGILGIAAAKKRALVDLCDTDDEAVKYSKENFENNNVSYSNIWEGSISKAPQKYDLIIANIVADVLGFIANDIYKQLNDNGLVILSGILDKYEQNVLNSYSKFTLVEKKHLDEWVTLVMKKEG